MGSLSESNIEFLDCSIQSPVHLICNCSTGLVIVTEDVLLNKQQLRAFIKELALNMHKYSTIWLIINIRSEQSPQITHTVTEFYGAISLFPLNLVTRIAYTSHHLSELIVIAIRCAHIANVGYEEVLKRRRKCLSQVVEMDQL